MKRVSTELVCAIAVILSGAAGGGYFYLRGEEPVKVVVAVKLIEAGPITPADVRQTTIKRRDIPKWLKASDARRGTKASDIPFDDILVGAPNEVNGTANIIEPGCFIYTNAPGEFRGAQFGGVERYGRIID